MDLERQRRLIDMDDTLYLSYLATYSARRPFLLYFTQTLLTLLLRTERPA